MPIVTDITKLSQTAASNGPDGTVDPPSSLDDQDRYHGAFIAMLRDGVGFSAGAAVAALGFTPVQQGDGIGQTAGSTNKIKIGWSAGSKLLVTVDSNNFGDIWPINADAASGLRSGGAVAGSKMTFNWSGQSGTPPYVWGGSDGVNMYVYQPSQMTVGTASNANACSGNAATASTASNANAVNGISGWNYSNRAKNPAYIWVTDGSASDQYLTQPGNISVNYANSAGSAPANGGTSAACSGNAATASSANSLGNGNVTALNLSGTNFIGNVGGSQYWWPVNALSDARLKKDIAPTVADSLGQITRMRFVGFRWRDDLDFEIGDSTFNPVGVLGQEAKEIEPKWFSQPGEWMQPNQYAMLMSAMHAIQQLSTKVAKLSQLITGGS
jgi:hypothetical protein